VSVVIINAAKRLFAQTRERSMTRVVAVSNRVGPVKSAALAGGLAVALVDALRRSKGLWFGWSGNIVDDASGHHVTDEHGLTLATVDLTHGEHRDYYLGFANRCLWPLFHFRPDLMQYDRHAVDVYRHVNTRFAKALLPLLRADDVVWVHDYHLFHLAGALRGLRARQRIGFFLHTPFPPRDIMVTLPNHAQMVRALFDYDLIGFQTPQDLARFHEYVLREAGGRVSGTTVAAYGQHAEADAFPVGIDAEQFFNFGRTAQGEREFRRMREALRERAQIIGVDRLDYSKGLMRRLSAFEMLLERHADLRGKIELLQIAPISRGELKAYRDFRRDLEKTAVRINGRFGRVDWTPVRYLNQALPRRSLAGLYRASRVGLVTPMRDGMNLVAKEYVAAQDTDDPGVLVLSLFAGAAQQMTSALLVNPFDAHEVAEALRRGLMMSLAERRERHHTLMQDLIKCDSAHWAHSFIDTLRGTQRARIARRIPKS
jgi:trehalose 6-phosphate synthase